MKFFFAAIVLIGLCGDISAQTRNNQVIPPPPDAASLGKFGDVPVSMYNGTPDVTIPIWTVEVNDIKVPISLGYHSGGIALTEVPPWVGTGWALNSGGVITRSVRGMPDDGPGGFLTHPNGTLPECPVSGSGGFTYFNNAANGTGIDLEPDMFYFNFCGVSGKFVIDQSGNAHTIPYSNIKITRNPDNPGTTGFISWKITTGDGLIYLFDEQETAQTISNTTILGGSPANNTTNYTVSWYLKEISLPYTPAGSSQKVTFTYDAYNLSYTIPDSETKYETVGTGVSCQHNDSFTLSNYIVPNAKRLRKITFPNGSIEFLAGKYRHELQGGQVLDKIIISNATQAIKTVRLNYNYFSTNSMVEFASLADATSSTPASSYLRLSLKSVQEFDGSEIVSKAPYLFQYESNTWLPDRLTSKAQDHWGFYNGEVANSTLIPQHINSNGDFIDGAVRNAVESFAKAGTLNKITYPTGGSTTFNYELNDTESSLYPNNFTKISSAYSLGLCVNGKPSSFVINDQITQKATLKLSFTSSKWPTLATANCSNGKYVNGQPSSYIYFNIYDVSNPANPVNMNVTGSSVGLITIGYASANYTTNIVLPNGTYQIEARRGSATGPEVQGGENNLDGVYLFSVSGVQYQPGSKKIGGLRIATITDYDPVSNQNIVKKYDYTDNNLSTGDVQYAPQYNYQFDQIQACPGTDGTTNTNWITFDVYNAFSNTPLTTVQGGITGYRKVTVLYGKDVNGNYGINGKSEYFYSSPFDFNFNPIYRQQSSTTSDCYNTNGRTLYSNFPFAPAISMDWDRGLLTQQIDYQNKSGIFSKVKQIVNTYKDDYLGDPINYNSTTDVLAAKVAQARTIQIGLSSLPLGLSEIVAIQYYYIPSRFNKLISTQETDYDISGNNPVSSSKNYYYDNLAHIQLSRTVASNSDGTTTTTQNLYPLDYTNTTGFLNDMNFANIIVKPVEVVKYKTNGSTNTIIGGQLINYKAGTAVGLPDKIYKLETVSPIQLSLFKFSNQSAAGVLPNSSSPSAYTSDGHYPVVPNNSLQFDIFGNMTANTVGYGTTTGYQWGYNNQYPVAQVTNAKSNDIFFDSFEEGDGNSTIGDSKTGHYSHTGTYSKALTGLDNGTYILTYWQKSGSAWSLQTSMITISGSTYTISLSGQIDDVRFYPSAAQMTTYTYDPLVGMTSSTDAKSETTCYEYDGFQRLMNIKDKDGNIVKSFTYHYQGQ